MVCVDAKNENSHFDISALGLLTNRIDFGFFDDLKAEEMNSIRSITRAVVRGKQNKATRDQTHSVIPVVQIDHHLAHHYATVNRLRLRYSLRARMFDSMVQRGSLTMLRNLRDDDIEDDTYMCIFRGGLLFFEGTNQITQFDFIAIVQGVANMWLQLNLDRTIFLFCTTHLRRPGDLLCCGTFCCYCRDR